MPLKREELVRSKEYWVTNLQLDLYAQVEAYMKKHDLSRAGLAKKLDVSKGYITQILNGDFDHRLSKFIEISISVDKVPIIRFADIDEYIREDHQKRSDDVVTSPVSLPYQMNFPISGEFVGPSYKITNNFETNIESPFANNT